MYRKYYRDFVQTWLPTLKKQYKKGDYNEKKAIRQNIFKNINLTDKQKEKIWEIITRF